MKVFGSWTDTPSMCRQSLNKPTSNLIKALVRRQQSWLSPAKEPFELLANLSLCLETTMRMRHYQFQSRPPAMNPSSSTVGKHR